MQILDKIFIDTNILVYASNRNELIGQTAYKTLSSLRDNRSELFISAQTLREYANAIIRMAIADKKDLRSAITNVQKNVVEFQNQFNVLLENKTVISIWQNMLPQLKSNKQVYDYYIAATMQAHNINAILTHNVNDFLLFKNLTVIALK